MDSANIKMKNIDANNPAETEPPLRALRAFEAFARQGTVMGAARELQVTPSAVSHQLSLLEAFVQASLTVRRGRVLELTDEGREYYRSIHTAFSVLRGATNSVMQKSAPRQVTLAIIPLVATGALIPRLDSFLQNNPNVQLNIVYSLHRNYLSDSADLSIRYGTGEWPGYKSTKLLSGATKPVCSPAFLDRYGAIHKPADLLGVPLVHDGERSRWTMWLQSAGVKTAGQAVGPMFEDAQLAMSAVASGLGVGLLREALIQRELAAGTLVKLFDMPLHMGMDYYLCMRNDDLLPDAVQKMAAWLLKTLR